MIPDSTVTRVREATDIVALIGSFIPLKKDGAGFKGCCPFHNEKSGSFNVNPVKQFYHCFGCGASGDAIRFLQEHKGLSFADAVKQLGAQHGIHVEENARPRKIDPAKFTYSDPDPPERTRKTETPSADQPRRRKSIPGESAEPFDWDPCVSAFTREQADRLAEWRGYSLEFVQWMHREKLVGLYRGNVAIPVHDKSGAVVRCHYRLDDGRWMYFPRDGETAPLVIGNPSDAGHTLAFESQWDAFAVLDKLGYHEDPSAFAAIITRGATSNTDFSGFEIPTIVAVPQNDPDTKRNKKTGLTPAEDWQAKIRETRHSGTRVVVGKVPLPYKDANDWIRDGKPSSADVRKAVIETARSPIMANAWNVGDLMRYNTEDDPNALIGHKRRFLSKGGSLIITGPSGIGKSTLATSMAVHWAAGAPWHGIEVRRPLKIAVVQAENDQGDLAEMFRGAAKMAERDFAPDDRMIMARNLLFFRQSEKVGEEFCRWLEEVIRESGADVVFIDPLLSYVGGDISKQEVASQFFRTWLQPVLNRTGAIAILVHHTGKTSSDAKARSHWQESDYSYIGIGSSEVTNWPRAMAAIMPIPAHEKKYRLMLTKRGARAGMTNREGQIGVSTIFLEHGLASEGLAWNQIEDPDKDEKEDRARRSTRGRPPERINDIRGYLRFLPDSFKYGEGVSILRQVETMTIMEAKRALGQLLQEHLLCRESAGVLAKTPQTPELFVGDKT